MSTEDKKFLDGLLVGAIVVAIIIALIIGFAVFKSTPDNQKPPLISREKEVAPQQEVQTVVNSGKVGESTKLNGQDYLVFAAYKSPSSKKVVRLLIDKSKNNTSFLEKALKYRPEIGCISKKTVFINKNFDYEGLITLSYWDTAGERLLNLNRELIDSLLLNQFSCLQINNWPSESSLQLTVVSGDASGTSRQVYILNLETFNLELLEE